MKSKSDQYPMVRVTGLLVEREELLVIKQVLSEQSHWNLPGGTLEKGESLSQCLIREMEEETGLRVEVDELLYICDRFKSLSRHVIDISFSIRRVAGTLSTNPHYDGDEAIGEIKMVPLEDLPDYGFTKKFIQIVSSGFPLKGSYQGNFHDFYG